MNIRVSLIVAIGILGLNHCVQRSAENRRQGPVEVATTPDTPNVALPDAKVMGIIDRSCSGAACHSAGSKYGAYSGDAQAVSKAAATIYASVDSNRMPITSTGKSLLKADRTYLLDKMKVAKDTTTSGGVKNKNEGTATNSDVVDDPLRYCKSIQAVKDVVAKAPSKATFAQVDEVTKRTCMGSTCHSVGVSGRQIFVGDEAKTKSLVNSILPKTADNSMPPGGAKQADREIYYTYFCK